MSAEEQSRKRIDDLKARLFAVVIDTKNTTMNEVGTAMLEMLHKWNEDERKELLKEQKH